MKQEGHCFQMQKKNENVDLTAILVRQVTFLFTLRWFFLHLKVIENDKIISNTQFVTCEIEAENVVVVIVYVELKQLLGMTSIFVFSF